MLILPPVRPSAAGHCTIRTVEARLVAVQGFLRLLTIDSMAAPSAGTGGAAGGASVNATTAGRTSTISPYEVLGRRGQMSGGSVASLSPTAAV